VKTSFKLKLSDLQPLIRVPTSQWYKFGVEYKNIRTDSSGFALSGTLINNRKFTLNQLTKKFEFITKSDD
jgi:hypothetical protein